MDFSFSEEQTMLRDSLRAFLADRYVFGARSRAVASKEGRVPGIWRAFADELGVLGAAFPVECGGLGGGDVENMIVMEELGAALANEPWLQSVVMSGELLRGGGSAALEAAGAVVRGEWIVVPALDSMAGAAGGSRETLTATRTGDGFLLNGRTSLVWGAPFATHFLISARLENDKPTTCLFLAPADASGLKRENVDMVDGSRAAEIQLTNTPASAAIGDGDAPARMSRAFDAGVAALCAEALGIQRHLLRATASYAKQRRQFGRAISEFQVLQHRMADMLIKVEESASMTYMATLSLHLPQDERQAAISAAKVAVDQASRFIGQSAIQIHGGIGIARELPVADYFARLTAISLQMGSTDFHVRRYEAHAFAA